MLALHRPRLYGPSNPDRRELGFGALYAADQPRAVLRTALVLPREANWFTVNRHVNLRGASAVSRATVVEPDGCRIEPAAPNRSGNVLTTDDLDRGHHAEEIVTAEEVGLCVEHETIEARADGPHRIQEWPHSEGGFASVLQVPHHEGLPPNSPVDALPSGLRHLPSQPLGLAANDQSVARLVYQISGRERVEAAPFFVEDTGGPGAGAWLGARTGKGALRAASFNEASCKPTGFSSSSTQRIGIP